ncbi:hypothetical protein PILCRDRAFT_338624 [Piloderma croceum F 1598]|uniref:SWR1-complex protein 5 n=1 Tax=Piloderma croceum (strain F 1598) TaxID=765440 RepID=A0A0C3C7G8_PILCF|nr:hypothetical protein PILCRDRAFT_338624 [Piloderma croceum F 1598]
MSSLQHSAHESDSEDDSDYVPPADAESSDEETEANDVKVEQPELTEEEEIANKKTRENLWAEFQASVATPPPSKPDERPRKMVKIEKRYLFAGKEVLDIIEVPDDSPDARKWPLWRPPEQENTGLFSTSSADCVDQNAAASSSDALLSPSASKPQPTPGKRPGPRKPKTSLAALPSSQKAKKLTTLDKSAMDWNAHVNTQQDAAIKDELQANRRGGGYLEKVEFLKRVEERKEDALEASKSKRRRL